MKKCTVILSICFGCYINATAQVPSSQKANHNTALTRVKQNPLHSGVISLSSESSNLAKSGSDPILNLSMDSSNIKLHMSSTLNSEYTANIPKHAYGYANGRLLLRATGATSSGTITGSGVVGTGSSLGNIGSTGSGIGLNGKTPDAGSEMWGNARGFLSIPREKKIITN